MEKVDNNNMPQTMAYQLIEQTNCSFFLTGRAGTGKTTFLKRVQEEIDKNFIILAPTGVAALNAGGDTIHSFFGLPIQVLEQGTVGHINEMKAELMRNVDTIIIDEASMVRCDVVDAIDYNLRRICHNSMPFAGKQVVFVGDMYQLPPIVKQGDEARIMQEIYGYGAPFFFKARVFKRMHLPTIELLKVYRQEDDPEFINILDRVRHGQGDEQDIYALNSRVQTVEDHDGFAITLSAYNRNANTINMAKLAEIDAQEYCYDAIIKDDFGDGKCPVDEHLVLKVGAQVMMCRNDQAKRWVNGTLGEVVELSEDSIKVKLDNGRIVDVHQVTWESYKYENDEQTHKIKKSVVGTFTQYPLRLAWAITIHKSQGLTFDRMNLDLSQGVFAPGQLYVAISRVRSLEGLRLTSPVKKGYINQDDEVIRFASSFNNEELINDELEIGRTIYPLFRDNKVDEAATALLDLAVKKEENGQLKEAAMLLSKLMDTMIDDSHLLHTTKNTKIVGGNTTTPLFINAVNCLYGDRYEDAVLYATRILGQRPCKEAFYIKARALDLMGRHQDADDAYNDMSDILKNDFDAKTYFQVGVHNESFTNDPGINLMQYVVVLKPYYDHALIVMREAMKKKDMLLKMNPDDCNALAVAFNSKITSQQFADALQMVDKEERSSFYEIISMQNL